MFVVLIFLASITFLIIAGIRRHLLLPLDAYVTSSDNPTEQIRTWDPQRFWSSCYDVLVVVTQLYGHELFKYDRESGLWVSHNRTLPLHAKDLVRKCYYEHEKIKRCEAVRTAKERVWGNVIEGNKPSTPRPKGQ